MSATPLTPGAETLSTHVTFGGLTACGSAASASEQSELRESAVKEDESANPADVGLFRTEGVMLRAKSDANAVEKARLGWPKLDCLSVIRASGG